MYELTNDTYIEATTLSIRIAFPVHANHVAHARAPPVAPLDANE